MKRIVQKIKSYSKSIELSEGDKDALRANITAFIKAHPIEENKSQAFKSPYIKHIFPIKQPLAAALIVSFIAVGGITSAAEYALPGDLLYPIKVHVNENLHSALIFGNTAEASWYTQRAERRIEEIERLIARGELSEEKMKVAQIHLENALNSAEKYSNPTRFEVILATHANILSKIDDDHKLPTDIKTTIEETKKTVTKKKYQKIFTADSENRSTTTPTLEGVLEKQIVTKNRINRIAIILSELDLDRNTLARASIKAQQAIDAFVSGSAAIESKDYARARDKFIESMMLIQEAKLIAYVPNFAGFNNNEIKEDTDRFIETAIENDTMVVADITNEEKEREDENGESTPTSTDPKKIANDATAAVQSAMENIKVTTASNTKDEEKTSSKKTEEKNDRTNDKASDVQSTVKNVENKARENQSNVQESVKKLVP